MSSFVNFLLHDSLLTSLSKAGYLDATDIQASAIPEIIAGKDVLASSKTGTGKTAAFVIPVISKIIHAKINNLNRIYALIIAPTRELANQIRAVVNKLSSNNIKTACLFGGGDIIRQVNELKKNPDIVIATLGRIQDHINRKNIKLSRFNILVLDEFDRMLDMGFREETHNIIRSLHHDRQILMFSATTRKSIISEAKIYLNEPKIILLSDSQALSHHDNIEQKFVNTSDKEKYNLLLSEINSREGAIIIFVNKKILAQHLRDKLYRDQYDVETIHGDLRQRQRDHVIKNYRREKYRILVATDVVARGIDIPHISHVINYDIPRNLEDYTHRIGRTGRFNNSGQAITFVLPSEKKIQSNIIKSIDSDHTDSGYASKQKTSSRNKSNFKNKTKSFVRNKNSNNKSLPSNRAKNDNFIDKDYSELSNKSKFRIKNKNLTSDKKLDSNHTNNDGLIKKSDSLLDNSRAKNKNFSRTNNRSDTNLKEFNRNSKSDFSKKKFAQADKFKSKTKNSKFSTRKEGV